MSESESNQARFLLQFCQSERTPNFTREIIVPAKCQSLGDLSAWLTRISAVEKIWTKTIVADISDD